VLATPQSRPLYLGTAPDPVFGFFHPAMPGEERETAVLLSPPFGWDDVCSYRSRLRWAEDLASRGHPALRIDLPGAGDSAGSPLDPGRLTAWRDAVTGASAWLRANTPCTRVGVIGMGVGGFAACLAVADGAAIDDLVLWAVPARGRSLLRELKAFAALKAAEFPDPDAEPPPPGPEGYLEAAGYVMTPETTAALQAADLTELEIPDAAGRRALLLDRDGVKADSRLSAHLEAAGVAVTVMPGPGYGEMVTNPQEARPPAQTFETVAGWLAEAPGSAGAPAPPAPAASDSLDLMVDGRAVRESSFRVALPTGDLFAILAEPVDSPAAPVGVVLTNAGAVRRIGPNRMWVELARRWAARGIPVVRLDIEGLGDSDGNELIYAHTPTMYDSTLAPQMRAAIDELEGRGVASRFVVGGLCAGAFWSFHVLREDPRVSAALMLNLFAFFWDDELPAAVEVRRLRKLARLTAWKRVLRGEVTRRQIAAVLRWIVRTPLDLRARLSQAKAHRDRVDEAFDDLVAAEKRAILLLGRGEPLVDQLRREGRLEQLHRWPSVELHQLPTRDHTFRAVWLQDQVHELMDEALEEEVQRATPLLASAAEGP
jgi:dienelactone hydrolase